MTSRAASWTSRSGTKMWARRMISWGGAASLHHFDPAPYTSEAAVIIYVIYVTELLSDALYLTLRPINNDAKC